LDHAVEDKVGVLELEEVFHRHKLKIDSMRVIWQNCFEVLFTLDFLDVF